MMRGRRVFVGLLGAALVTCPSVAMAEGGVREHDGFYLRVGIGPGYALGTNKASGFGVNANVRAMDISTEIAVGGTVLPGLVVGGGTFSMVAPSPKYKIGDTEATAGGHHVSGTGVFADYYFDPHKGLHAQTALLFAAGYLEGKDGKESGLRRYCVWAA